MPFERIRRIANLLLLHYPSCPITEEDRALAHRVQRWITVQHFPELGHVYEGEVTLAAMLSGYDVQHESTGWAGTKHRDTYIGIEAEAVERDRYLTLAPIPRGTPEPVPDNGDAAFMGTLLALAVLTGSEETK